MNPNLRKICVPVLFITAAILLLAPATASAVRLVDTPSTPEEWPTALYLMQDINTSKNVSNPKDLTPVSYLPLIKVEAPNTLPIIHIVDVNPSIALPGDVIRVISGNWTPGVSVSVSIVEAGQPYTQAFAVPGTTVTTPANPAQGFTIQFVFPDDPRWQIPADVWVYIHNAGWTEWGRGTLELREE